MSAPACSVPLDELVAYWLDELDAAAAERCEAHFFACDACSARLGDVAGLSGAIRRVLAGGRSSFVLPAAFVRRVKDAGLRVREYSVEPGGSVDCTVTRADDLVVAYLHAPLADVRRLDVVIDDSNAGRSRANDVPFDPAAPCVAAVPSVAYLRTLRHAEQRVQLVAVDGVRERVLGDYTFRHYPS